MDVVSLTRRSAGSDGDVASGRHEGVGDGNGGGAWGPAEVVGEAVVANAHLCSQVAAVLCVSEGSVRRALLGESVRIALGISGWLLYRDVDEEKGADEDVSRELVRRREALLAGWAERRGRGVWRKASERRVERCDCGTASKDRRRRLSSDEVQEMADRWCAVCRGSGVRLKALLFPSGSLVAEPGYPGDSTLNGATSGGVGGEANGAANGKLTGKPTGGTESTGSGV